MIIATASESVEIQCCSVHNNRRESVHACDIRCTDMDMGRGPGIWPMDYGYNNIIIMHICTHVNR